MKELIYYITLLSKNSFPNMYDYYIKNNGLSLNPPAEVFSLEREWGGSTIKAEVLGKFKSQMEAYRAAIKHANTMKSKNVHIMYLTNKGKETIYQGEK